MSFSRASTLSLWCLSGLAGHSKSSSFPTSETNILSSPQCRADTYRYQATDPFACAPERRGACRPVSVDRRGWPSHGQPVSSLVFLKSAHRLTHLRQVRVLLWLFAGSLSSPSSSLFRRHFGQGRLVDVRSTARWLLSPATAKLDRQEVPRWVSLRLLPPSAVGVRSEGLTSH